MSSTAGTAVSPVCRSVFVPPPPESHGESSRSSCVDFGSFGETEIQKEMKLSFDEQSRNATCVYESEVDSDGDIMPVAKFSSSDYEPEGGRQGRLRNM